MAEKVRYYLEQSVPELEDLQKKGLFDKREITMIMRRRTDLEHRIQGRGSTGRDFLKYGEFEQNLEKLRKKRYKRLSKAGLVDRKPSVSDWSGVRRILFIYDRGTNRFPNNLDIWSNYLTFAKENGAIKVIYKIYSKLLQLQPRNIDAWLSAAKYEFESNNNAKGARVLFQRGLRFNSDSMELWLNYFQFELVYIAKLLTRRKVLGLITEKQQLDQLEAEQSEYKEKLNEKSNQDLDSDKIALPTEDLRDELNTLPDADMNMLGNPETNPALKGDVALAIFDSCISSVISLKDPFTKEKEMKRLFELMEKFLSIIDKFDNLNQDYLQLHILNYLQTHFPQDLRTLLIDITLAIRNMDKTDENFADNLQLSVNKFFAYKMKMTDTSKKSELTFMFTEYLKSYLTEDKTTDHLIKAIIAKCQS